MADFLDWIGTGTGRVVTVRDVGVLCGVIMKAEVTRMTRRPAWMDRLKYVWPMGPAWQVTESFEAAWTRLTNYLAPTYNARETWRDEKGTSWQRRHHDFVVGQAEGSEQILIYRIDHDIPDWVIGLESVWSEDEYTRNDPDAEKLEQAWVRRYGVTMPPIVFKHDGGDTTYRLHEDGRASASSFDGYHIMETPSQTLELIGRVIPNRYGQDGGWWRHRPMSYDTSLNGYKGTWEVEIPGQPTGLYRLRYVHPACVADPVSSKRATINIDERERNPTHAWTRMRPAARCPVGDGRTKCVRPMSHDGDCEPEPCPALPDDWVDILYAALAGPGMVACRAAIMQDRQAGGIWPNPSDIFRPFWSTSFWSVRVVILGLTPSDADADGLAYSTRGKQAGKLTRPLIEAAEQSSGKRWTGGGSLSGWTRQGVLLLNSYLTCRAGGEPHKGWEDLTRAALLALLERPVPTAIIAPETVSRGILRSVLKGLRPHRRTRDDVPHHLLLETFDLDAVNAWLHARRLCEIDWADHL